MQAPPRPRSIPYRFDHLTPFTRQQLVLWNWYSRVGPDGVEWRSWLSEILEHLVERPDAQQLTLVQTHLVDAEFGEKLFTFGCKQELFLGRGADNDVVLPAKAIASRHVRLVLNNRSLYIEDLGGRLGTYVWDKRIEANNPRPLANGDQFSIFPYRFRVLLEQSWAPETEVAVDDCRVQPRTRAEFLAMSPVGRWIFLINPHPAGDRALLELNPTFLAELQQRILIPLGLTASQETIPSNDVFAEFVILALLERLNRRLKFPVQFSFSRGKAYQLADTTPGLSLSTALRVGDLTGHFRVFLPLEFLSKYRSDTTTLCGAAFPNSVGWKFPVSIAFVDLSPDEIAQIGLGDILVTENAAAALFPNNFSKGWSLVEEQSNSARFRVDKYFERSMSVDSVTDSPTTASRPDLGALPLRLHVVLGEKELTLAEIQSFAPETILELEGTKSDPVRLMVNGKILGEGELVDVEGKLAVKVLGWRHS
jgi:flagellar motor switch/type III secretory pathway protein FliN/pSer/pThr/pTyr-binding forkhead associated (FHA) protein